MIRIFTDDQNFISRYLGKLSLKKKRGTVDKTTSVKFTSKKNPNEKSSSQYVPFSEVLEEAIQKRK